MANRFGSSYEFEQQMKNDTLHQHSSIHEQVHQLARKKKEMLAKKVTEKAEREMKKEYIVSGSGHHKIDSFLSPPAGRRNKRSSSVPVTDDMGNRPRPIKKIKEEKNKTTNLEDDPCYQELAEFICNEHIGDDEAELARQEHDAGYQDDGVVYTNNDDNAEVELLAVSYPKEKLDEYIVNSIEGTVCKACGNGKEDCHNMFFGAILSHEVLTKLQEGLEPLEATDEWIEAEFTDKYRLFLRFHCFHMYGKYDECQDYELPKCIVQGYLEFTKTIVKHESIMLHLKQKRAHGVAKSFFGRGGGKSGFNHNNEKEE